jgi:hypothetical protein
MFFTAPDLIRTDAAIFVPPIGSGQRLGKHPHGLICSA